MAIKKTGFFVMLVVILSFVCVVSSSGASSKFAAKVNGVGVKNITLDAAVNNFIKNQELLGISIKEEDKDKLRKDILEELISAELLYQESKKASLGDLGKEVETQFENIKKGFNSDDEFQKVLKDRGITEKDLKEDIRKGVYIKTFLDKKLYNDITVSEAEKEQEFEKNKDRLNLPEQVRASHILIRVAKDATSEDKDNAREKIDQLRERVLSGEDFSGLAKENSEDGSAPRGGDLGYFRRGDMIKPFEDVAFSLEKGALSDVVETQFGYHIIKVVDKQPARILAYDEVAGDIERFLLNQRKKDGLDVFIEDLRKKAKIERY